MLSLWNPFLPVRAVKSDNEISTRDLFDRVVQNSWNDFIGMPINHYGIEYAKTEDSLSASIELPGIKAGDLSVSIKDNLVSIKAERKTKTSTYSINKSFSLPEGFDTENVEAELLDGILTLSFKSLPKVGKTAKQIEIKTPVNVLNK